MYNQIIENLERQLSDKEYENLKSHPIHLGIFREPYLTYMLEGKKTIESRFSKNKILPYKSVSSKDIIIVKKSSGPIIGYFTVGEVFSFNLRETSLDEIRRKYEKELCVSEQFWESKRDSNYATLMTIENLTMLTPFSIDKRGMQTWIKF